MRRLEDENNNYRLWVSDYYGNATDSFSVHNGYHFSTVDRNNDEAPKCCPCAPSYGGGWWFYRYIVVSILIKFHKNKMKDHCTWDNIPTLIFSICSCFESNLNGEYHEDPEDNGYYHGIIWELWRGDYSLKSSRMMIRSKALHDMINMDPNNSMNNEVVRLDYL